jgi:hypothetical protein
MITITTLTLAFSKRFFARAQLLDADLNAR